MNMLSKLRHMYEKAVRGILAIALCAGSGILPHAVHAEANTVNAYADSSETMNVYVNVNARDHTGALYLNYYGIEGVIVDTKTGKKLFCVEPGPIMSEGVHTSIGTIQSYFGKEKGDKIQLISYYGTLSGTKTDYFAAQSLIWEVAYNTEVQQRGSNGAAINAAKQVIMSKVNAYLASGRAVRGTSEVYRSSGQDVMSMGTVVFDKDIQVSISKHSANLAITSNSDAYSLAGAKYRVYEGKNTNGKLLAELTTDENGNATRSGITVTYETTHVTFVEVQAPKGYELNETPFTVTIENNLAHVDVNETPVLQKLAVTLKKTSLDETISANNANYSLAWAVYEVFYVHRDKEVVLGQLTTDENGNAYKEYEGIPLGIETLFVRELVSPSGYVCDNRTFEAKNENGTAVFNVQDKPVSAMFDLEIEKMSEDAVENPAPLSDAEFTVSFYSTLSSVSDLAGLKPERTWVLKTRKDNETGKYLAKMEDAYLVSGDPFYVNEQGEKVLPLGVLTIQETKAPAGYTLDHTLSCLINGKEEVIHETDGVAMFPIYKNSSSTATIISAEKFTYAENVARGGLKLQKHDTVTMTQPQGNASNLVTAYQLINLNPYDVAMKADDQIVCVAEAGKAFSYLIVTDENGAWKSDLSFLQTGRYRLVEITAPEGYTLTSNNSSFTTVMEFQVLENQYCDLTGNLGDEIKRGGFQVKKNDADINDRQGDTNLSARFRLVNRSKNQVVVNGKTVLPGGVIDVDGSGNGWFASDENGWYVSSDQLLPYGTYELSEIEAPAGYKNNALNQTTFTIDDNQQMADISQEIFDEVVTGRFAIYKHYRKHDSSQWDDLPEQGAVFLAMLTSKLNSVFENDMIQAYEVLKNADMEDLKQLGVSSKEFSIVITDENGMGYSGELAYGSYTIRQVDGDPETFLNEETKIFEVKGQTSSKIDAFGSEVRVYDDQKILYYAATDVFRTYELKMVKKDAETGKTVSLTGASFMVGFDSNENDVWDDEDKNFSKKYNSYHSIENGFVVQTVGKQKYHIFRTASKTNEKYEKGTFVVDEENSNENQYGEAYTPVHVEYGHYFIFETDGNQETVNETPSGYVMASPVSVTASRKEEAVPVAESALLQSSYSLLYDENSETSYADEMDTIEAVVENFRALGKLNVHKTVHSYNADYQGAEVDFTRFVFELRASEDIMDPSDGTVIVHKGELAKTIVDGNYQETGKFCLDETGSYTLDRIPLGNYELKETEVSDTFVTNYNTWNLTIKQDADDRINAVYEEDVQVTNYPTLVSVSKKAVTGEDELEGACLHVEDQNGEVVDSWISSDKPHLMEGLKKGHTYRLIEDLAPLGYVKASSVYFTVLDEKDVQKVTMTDRIVEVVKQDCSFSSIKGASMQVIDEEGKVIDEWISDGKVHRVSHLETDKTYTLQEVKAPEGYVRAKDIVFTVKDDGKNVLQIMVDKQVTIVKEDADGKRLEGALLGVFDEDDNLIDTWVADDKNDHAANGLVEGNTYVLKELEVPDGYVKANDQMFTVDETKENIHIVMVNKKVEAEKNDEEGKPVKGAKLSVLDETGEVVDTWITDGNAHRIQHLQAGKTYTLHEEESDELAGYYLNEDMFFTAEDDGKDQSVTFEDHSIVVKIEKLDEEGKYVSGAKLTLKDLSCKEEVPLENDGITSEKPFVLKQVLHAGHSYELVEEEAGDGYHPAQSILFDVPLYSSSRLTVRMIDVTTSVSFLKTDENGKAVKNARFVIQDEEGHDIYRFTSSDKPIDLSGQLKGGTTYVLHEEESPFGYECMEDMKFEVTGTKEIPQMILAKDSRRSFQIKVHKTDEKGNVLTGAVFAVENEEGKILLDTEGNEYKTAVDENGQIIWTVNYEADQRYYLHELKAPQGYQACKERILIALDENYTFDTPVEVNVTNSLKPVTGDSSSFLPYIALCVSAVNLIFTILLRRKMKNK